jgi:hypothetical protein
MNVSKHRRPRWRCFPKTQQRLIESLPLGSLFWLPWIEAKPRDNPSTGLAGRLVTVALPANEGCQPNPHLGSNLPLRQAKLGPPFVEVFADGLGGGRQGRPDDA